ncbi:hypothetical protein [Paenarthrobacter sp. YJN-5]|uniref:hypothetical protein n=1 Tax=Paenarthrobacter sp. YJN-5 TaxID=2735316 RepID=UPI001877B518|nr:hypothetical protein [Paenarthrobacter sp. YJN-5]QOT15751.1 hypothetical protein HMI59_03535 [Paenarthrobacter sp. YJN-5]
MTSMPNETEPSFLPEQEWPENENVNPQNDEFLREVIYFLKSLKPIEPQITSLVLKAIPKGARPYGLEFRVKRWQSLHRKAKDMVRLSPYRFSNVSTQREMAHIALSLIEDVLRYSVLAEEHAELGGSLHSFIAIARANELDLRCVLNSYHPTSRYKGIHAHFGLHDRFALEMWVEVQFHSPESVEAYHDTHSLYEEFRVARDLGERQALHDQIEARYATLENVVLSAVQLPVPITDRVFARPR